MEKGLYQVGRAEFPHGDDPRFDSEALARGEAQAQCIGDRVIAVWKWQPDGSAEVVCLVYQSIVFLP